MLSAYSEKKFHSGILYVQGLWLAFSLSVITACSLTTMTTIPYEAPHTLSISLVTVNSWSHKSSVASELFCPHINTIQTQESTKIHAVMLL